MYINDDSPKSSRSHQFHQFHCHFQISNLFCHLFPPMSFSLVVSTRLRLSCQSGLPPPNTEGVNYWGEKMVKANKQSSRPSMVSFEHRGESSQRIATVSFSFHAEDQHRSNTFQQGLCQLLDFGSWLILVSQLSDSHGKCERFFCNPFFMRSKLRFYWVYWASA